MGSTIVASIGKKVLNGSKLNSTSPLETIKELIKVFEHEYTSAEEDDKPKWTNAIKHIKLHPIPYYPLVERKDGEETSKQVLDDVIASLRQKHIKAVSESGPEGEPAKRIEDALKTALNYRANMIYIRPSGMYLRSSYPATSLQNDPGLTRRNMLQEHALRSLPVLGGVFDSIYDEQEGNSEDKKKVVSEIDKQFWQNINQVKVTGGGITNYVIAKDDIGNWYVKEVATDPEPIIESARNLALYGLGSGLNTNLVGRVQRQDQLRQSQNQESALPVVASQATPLQRLFEKYETAYETKTKQDFEELKGAISLDANSLNDGIKKGWESNTVLHADFGSQLDKALEIAQGSLKAAREGLDKDTEEAKAERPSRIASALQALRRFHNNLIHLVKGIGITTPDATKLATAEKAKIEADHELEIAKRNAAQAQANQTAAENRLIALRDVHGPEKTVAEQDLTKAKEKSKNAQATVEGKQVEATNKAELVSVQQLALENAKTNETAALTTVTNLVKGTLEKFMRSRKGANKTFETSITFLGDATGE